VSGVLLGRIATPRRKEAAKKVKKERPKKRRPKKETGTKVPVSRQFKIYDVRVNRRAL
jgi:hypothetical protein